jgi:hypothetical protein
VTEDMSDAGLLTMLKRAILADEDQILPSQPRDAAKTEYGQHPLNREIAPILEPRAAAPRARIVAN